MARDEVESSDAQKTRAQAKSAISRLKDQLRSRDLSPQQRQEIYKQIGQQYEDSGAYFRARWNYEKAGDNVAIAKTYETQEKFIQAARIWRDLANQESARKDVDHLETAERRAELYGNAVRNFMKAYNTQNPEDFSPANSNYNQDAFYATLGLEGAEADIKFKKLSPKEKRKRKKDLEARAKEYHSFGPSEGSTPGPTPGTFFVLTVASPVLLIMSIFFFSSNITGNVIGLNQTSSNFIGIIFLILGLIGGFYWFKFQKKK